MPANWTKKDERQYQHILTSCKKTKKGVKVCKRIAAATVNKTRRAQGRTLKGASSCDITLEYGVIENQSKTAKARGWLPVFVETLSARPNKPRIYGDTWANRGYDKSEALTRAKARAQKEADHYTGDTKVCIFRLKPQSFRDHLLPPGAPPYQLESARKTRRAQGRTLRGLSESSLNDLFCKIIKTSKKASYRFNDFAISGKRAGELAKAVDAPLPRSGYELALGKGAFLTRFKGKWEIHFNNSLPKCK